MTASILVKREADCFGSEGVQPNYRQASCLTQLVRSLIYSGQPEFESRFWPSWSNLFDNFVHRSLIDGLCSSVTSARHSSGVKILSSLVSSQQSRWRPVRW
jgi:hypothetical protein